MSVLFVLLPISLGMSLLALCGFIWAAKKGQFDDLKAAQEMLIAEDRLYKEERNG